MHYEEFAQNVDIHDYIMLKMNDNVTDEFILTGWPNISSPMDYVDKRMQNLAVFGYYQKNSQTGSPCFLFVYRINYDSVYPVRIVFTARVTFPDKLASIGGILGIFLGLSFTGLFDLSHSLWLKYGTCKTKSKPLKIPQSA